MATTGSSSTLTFLRVSAGLTALLSVVQAVLAVVFMTSPSTLVSVHGKVGMATVVVSLIAAVAAYLWRKASGNVGMFTHAVSVFVLAVVQVGLGEMGAFGGLRTVHITIGVFFLVAAVALVTLAVRKPGLSTVESA